MPVDEPLLDAGDLAGLLADRDRLRVVAALALGAGDVAAVRSMTGLSARAASRAVKRLADAGLVEEADGSLLLLTEAFQVAARAHAANRPAEPDAHAEASREEAKVLRAFVRDGKLTAIPAQHAKRLVILEWLVQRFEPGRHYTEKMVNLIIATVHPDTAALRRALVDDGYLDRAAGEYWRSGGRVDIR